METPGDKMATTHAESNQPVPHSPTLKRGKSGKPVATAKFGSAKWFSIVPKECQWENAYKWDHRARVVTLPETAKE